MKTIYLYKGDTVEIDGEVFIATENGCLDVPIKAIHRDKNGTIITVLIYFK